MKIITKTVLVDFKGEKLKNGEDLLTVGDVISWVLSMDKTDNPYKSFLLAKKFASSTEVELEAEDIIYIKGSLKNTELWKPIVTGQIIEILEKK